ncbi:MAG: hypothetical protein IT580_14610 [Verrucomicrobiales bacterium]|nr:hypothetical protein [Verrucomicrobiales bacterium]
MSSHAVQGFPTDTAFFVVDDRGSLTAINCPSPNRNLVAPGQSAPLLQLRLGGQWHHPDLATWDPAQHRFALRFDGIGHTAFVTVHAKTTHLVLELTAIEPSPEDLEVALWGPYPIAIGETIGEIVGVVRDRRDAVGIQALNPKTLGGYPHQEHDIDAEHGADDTGYYPGLPDELKQGQGFRGDTARSAPFGSVLQAYTRNRSYPRVIANWGHDRFRVLGHGDGGLVGSRIALFAVPEAKALATLGRIELAEGLPHPTLNGVWAKTAREATAAYLIVDFSEDTIDRAIEMTRRAGLRYLYHSSPFETWGHFRLKPALFPRGWEGFQACVDKARAAGVDLGVHTLSNFITPNDPYVTPEPDRRLAVIGASLLAAEIDAAATEIPIVDPTLFAKKSALNAVRLGDELVKFESVATNGTVRLLKCQRGAWGTRALAHPTGTPVARLLDHDYQVFLSDLSLSIEIARNIADFCNRTGIRQLSFDGLEGNWSTGHGTYGRTLFTHAWHEALKPELRGTIINDASNPGHFNWHINTRMNWGEPWYAGFRESQTLYRFKNQVLFERNLMPHMLGWFALRADTSLEDAEWLLARAAGFDAGFALATSLASTAQLAADPASADTARQFGATTAILSAIAQWETARMAGAFTPEVKGALRDNRREFHLRPAGDHQWDLHEVFVARFTHAATAGDASSTEYRNPTAPQPLQWIIRSDAKVPVPGIHVDLLGQTVLDLGSQSIPAGGSLKYTGGSQAVIADASWKEVARLPVDPARARLGTGATPVQVGATLPAGATLRIELRTLGPATRLSKP